MSKQSVYTAPGSGIATGVGLGLLFGVMLDDLTAGVLIGIGVGLAFEATRKTVTKKPKKGKSPIGK